MHDWSEFERRLTATQADAFNKSVEFLRGLQAGVPEPEGEDEEFADMARTSMTVGMLQAAIAFLKEDTFDTGELLILVHSIISQDLNAPSKKDMH